MCKSILQHITPLKHYTLDVPGNGITGAGVDEVCSYLYNLDCTLKPYDADDPTLGKRRVFLPHGFEWVWQVPGKGEYVRALPKRIAKWYKQEHGIKLSAADMSEIGNRASRNCDEQRTYWFDFTHVFDWDSGDFGDGGSCYWTCRTAAREALEREGAWAIRFYKDDTYSRRHSIARAWIIEDRRLPLVYVWNGYGMETIKIARILSQFLDNCYYRQVRLENNKECDGTIWINSGRGYAVGAQDMVLKRNAYDFEIEVDDGVKCHNCSDTIEDEDEQYRANGNVYCETCFNEYFTYCDVCENDREVDDVQFIESTQQNVCSCCLSRSFFRCPDCEEYHHNDNAVNGPDCVNRCRSCHDEHFADCDDCDNTCCKDDITWDTETKQGLCPACCKELQDSREAEKEAEDA